MIDLHVHTTFSDGTFSPKELMDYAEIKGLKAIAVTDHDTVSGLKESKFYADEKGIEFIPGIEISTSFENKEYHILGYFIDETNDELLKFIKKSNDSRKSRNEKMVYLFNKKGIDISISELFEIAPTGIFNRMHFANLLMKKGVAGSKDEAFKKFLCKGCETYVAVDLPSPLEAFEKIIGAGGIPALAHPVNYKLSAQKLDEILGIFKSIGLAGIEGIYSVNSEDDEKLFWEMAQKHDLVITGGSDFHGKNKPDIDLGSGRGNLNIRYVILKELKSKLH